METTKKFSIASTGAKAILPDTNEKDWWAGVPERTRNNTSYFRNVDLDQLRFVVGKARSDMSNSDITITTNKSFASQAKLPKKNYDIVPVTFPPFRVRYPNLHATGDYKSAWTSGGVNDQVLEKAHHTCLLVEGNIPEKMKKQFPEIEREQAEALEFMNRSELLFAEKFWEDPELRIKHKERIEELYFDEDQSSVATIEKKKKAFLRDANVTNGNKAPLVKPPKKGLDSRHFKMTKSICSKIDMKGNKATKPIKWEPTGIKKDNELHYIDRLLELGYEYNAPPLRDPSGKPYSLGRNETPEIKDGDICIPTILFKCYDAGSYGTKMVLFGLQKIRSVQPGEIETGGENWEDFEEETLSVPSIATPAVPAVVEPIVANRKDATAVAPASPDATQAPDESPTAEQEEEGEEYQPGQTFEEEPVEEDQDEEEPVETKKRSKKTKDSEGKKSKRSRN